MAVINSAPEYTEQCAAGPLSMKAQHKMAGRQAFTDSGESAGRVEQGGMEEE